MALFKVCRTARGRCSPLLRPHFREFLSLFSATRHGAYFYRTVNIVIDGNTSRRCVESNDDVARLFRSILGDIQRFVNRVLGSMLQQCWLLFIFYLFMQAHSGRLSVYRPFMLFLVSIGLC